MRYKQVWLLSSLNWQKKNLQWLSAQELREKNMAWVPKGSTQTKTRMMFTQKEQHSWRRKEGPSDNIQIWGLHWIIKIIGCYIIHLPHKCHVCLCLEIHPIICLVSPHILILVLECHMGLYIMEGYHQIVVHIDYLKKPKYLIPRDGFNYWLYISLYTLFRLYMFLWMNSLWMIIYIIFDNIYGRWMSLTIILKC